MTVTTKQVHIHMQEMSSRCKKGQPNFTIARIAKDFGTTVDELQPHIDKLHALGFICHDVHSKKALRLTENGRVFNAES